MLVIFDCDGVLIDSEAIYCAVDAEAMTRLGHPTEPGDIARRFAGVPHSTAWATLSDEVGFAQPAGASHVCTTMPAILTFAEAWARRDGSLTNQTDSSGSPRPLSA